MNSAGIRNMEIVLKTGTKIRCIICNGILETCTSPSHPLGVVKSSNLSPPHSTLVLLPSSLQKSVMETGNGSIE